MGKVEAITVILIMVNLFLYPFIHMAPAQFESGAKSEIKDTVGGFAQIQGESVSFNNTDSSNAVPTSLQSNSIETGTGLATYASGLETVWSFVKFLFGLVGNIYVLLIKMNMPGLVAAMIGVPIVVLQVTGLVSFIRGFNL